MLATLLAAAALAAPPVRPNILFIMSDDHCKQGISCYGSRLTSTPGIDRIAREGIRFDRSSVTNAICGPSRAVMLTGKHSHANGFATNDQKFDSTQQTFPKLLRTAGYRTEVVPTHRRMSKRFGTFPGIRIRRKQRLAVVIDTSGSISETVLEVFFREIHGIWRNDADVIVIECDAAVQRTYPYKGETPKAVEGGGGTAFDPALAWVRDPRNGPFDACIYLTDGCAGEPDVRTRCPLLWVVTADGNVGPHLRSGRVIQLPGD